MEKYKAHDEIYQTLLQAEKYIDKSFTIWKKYHILKKSELIKKFENIYNSIPKELKENKDYIIENDENNVFVIFENVNPILMSLPTFLGLTILNRNDLEDIIDNIYSVLPANIMLCRNNEEKQL